MMDPLVVAFSNNLVICSAFLVHPLDYYYYSIKLAIMFTQNIVLLTLHCYHYHYLVLFAVYPVQCSMYLIYYYYLHISSMVIDNNDSDYYCYMYLVHNYDFDDET